MRTIRASAFTALALIGLAAPAAASTVSVSGTELNYAAATGEANTFAVTGPVADVFTVTDAAGVTITAGSGCTGGGAPGALATCTVAGATEIDVLLGDLDDSADTSAVSAVAARFHPEDGDDDVTAGAGFNDWVEFETLTAGITADLDAGTATGEGSDTLTGVENLSGSVMNDTFTGNASANSFLGASGQDTFFGGDGDDVLIPGSDSDEAHGGGDDDEIGGADGDDILTGGDGEDFIVGFIGDDILNGGADDDTLIGGFPPPTPGDPSTPAGSDLVDYSGSPVGVTVDLGVANPQATGDGTDILLDIDRAVGTGEDDILTGNDNANFLNGLQGADIIDGLGGGDDLIGGGDAGDLVAYTNEPASVTVNLITGTATTSTGSDTLTGFTDVVGSGSADTLIGDGNANFLNGFSGDDLLEGRLGDDIYEGGGPSGGTDTASFAGAGGVITANLATAGNQTTGEGTDVFSDIENLTGSPQDDDLTGDGNANLLQGGAGDDQFDGAGGSDRISFAAATNPIDVDLDTGEATGQATTIDELENIENVTGSPQGDTIRPSDDPNSIDGSGGNDTIYGVEGTFGLGNDTFDGGPGTSDELTYDPSTTGFDFNVPGATVTGDGTTDGFSNFELYTGSLGDDDFTGGPGVDNFEGLSGADVATGGASADNLDGGSNNDTLSGNGGVDVLDGDAGVDTASYSAAAAGATVTLTGSQAASNDGDGANDTLSGFENLTGSAFGDDLTGSAGVLNVINALAGADTIRARDGGLDNVDCGTAIDWAIVDATETAVTACEFGDDPDLLATPTIGGSNPPSGANNNSPQIIGNSMAESTVSLFTTADCSGAALVTGSAVSFETTGLTISVADNSTTTLYAQASSPFDADGPSACSAGFTYVESTPATPTPPPTPPAGDTTAPETTIAKLLKKTKDRTPTYSFTSTEAGSRFECKVDGGAFAACSSQFTLKKLKFGKHTFSVRAIDAAGNGDQTPATDAFKVKKKKKR